MDERWARVSVFDTAALSPDETLASLEAGEFGLSAGEAARRLAEVGPNAVRIHRLRWWVVLGRQVRSPLLLLLFVTATISFIVGDQADSLIISVILLVSVGLGFVNEYRAQLAAEALHTQIHHEVVVRRDDRAETVDVTTLVPGDMVHLTIGAIVPADVRVLAADGLECDESILTGESQAAEKHPAAIAVATAFGDMSSCAFMGTVVQAGSGDAVVVATGTRTQFGRIAVGLEDHQGETEFQAGLRHFSVLLVRVAGLLTTSIFVINVLLHRPLLESLEFSLAIAVGITPQLLPAVVTTSLATGSRVWPARRSS